MSGRRRPRALAAALAAVLLAPAACSSGGTSAEDESGSGPTSAPTEAADETTSPPTLAPGQEAHEVGTSFEHQSFVITVGSAVYDDEAQQLSLGLRFANVSGRWAQTDTTSALEMGDGTVVPFSGDLFQVPPGVAVEVTATAFPVPEDPVDDGVVTWGNAVFDQPVFRLDGEGGENLWLPAEVEVDGWAQLGKFGVHLTGLQVHASQLDLGIQAPPATRVLRTFVDEYTARGTTAPFDAATNLLLRLPSGEVVDAVHGSPFASRLSWTAQGGQWADFVVPAELDGSYELLLASVQKVGFGTIRPELIERRPIPFELADVEAGPAPFDEPLVLPLPYPPPPEGEGEAFDVDLDLGSMNIPGYDLRPTHLAYDPATRTATLDATVTSLISSVVPPDALLSADRALGFRAVLDTGGRLATGLVEGDATLDADAPTDLTFEFTDVRALSPDGAGLYVGPGDGAVSSMPLGEASDVVAWPPTPTAQVVDTPPVVAGDWTVQLRAYRIGLFSPDVRPTVGRCQLEVSLDATAAPTARPNALGLGFQPLTQVLLGGGTGYDQGPVFDSGSVEMTPGETVRFTVTFDVADTFQGGRTPFVVRSRSELDLLTHWIETRLLVGLTPGAAGEGAFG